MHQLKNTAYVTMVTAGRHITLIALRSHMRAQNVQFTCKFHCCTLKCLTCLLFAQRNVNTATCASSKPNKKQLLTQKRRRKDNQCCCGMLKRLLQRHIGLHRYVSAHSDIGAGLAESTLSCKRRVN
jgi:hypothetical protein